MSGSLQDRDTFFLLSRRTVLVAGTAMAASLLEGQMAQSEETGGNDGLKEYGVATNGISLHVTEQGQGQIGRAHV